MTVFEELVGHCGHFLELQNNRLVGRMLQFKSTDSVTNYFLGNVEVTPLVSSQIEKNFRLLLKFSVRRDNLRFLSFSKPALRGRYPQY